MYTGELKHLVATHKNINKVYFTASGEHFLNPRSFKDALFGNVINGVPVKETLIVNVVERDVILNGAEKSEVKEIIKEHKKTKK